MQPISEWFTASVPSLVGQLSHPSYVLVDVALKGTVLLLLAMAAVFLLRRSARMDDADWQTLLEELRRCIRLRRRVDLLASEGPLIPMTWGLLRPVVLLPNRARSWTGRLRRFVLLHELAHVKRWDVGLQMLARRAGAVAGWVIGGGGRCPGGGADVCHA
ncbi:MAG: M56 family metallopeptidase [Pirellulales bacterium]